MNLYRIELAGMKTSYGTCFVIATDPTAAYEQVKTFLDKEDIGYLRERVLETITLIAETKTVCEIYGLPMLYL